VKILLINYRYFVSGGPERYMFNLTDLLSKHGHEVIPFSIRYSKNAPSEYDKFFVNPLSNENEVYFKNQSWNLGSVAKTIERLFYSQEVYDSLHALIKETKPDFAIVQNYLKKMSPSVLVALSDNRVPFVVRLSDFFMVCPAVHLFRNDVPCELCVHGSLLNSVRYKCVQNSFAASLLNYTATQYHEFKGFFDLIRYFIVPSSFTKSMMVAAGWNDESVVHIPTFVNTRKATNTNKKNQIAFIGRLEYIKGVELFLDALGILQNDNPRLDFSTVIVGGGDEEYVSRLTSIVARKKIQRLTFSGSVDAGEVMRVAEESIFTVAPSLWYDNSPNSVLESLSCGTPVIAPRHGSFPEIVIDGKTGLLFNPSDVNDLAAKIVSLAEQPEICAAMSIQAREFVSVHHSAEKHYEKLMALYPTLIS